MSATELTGIYTDADSIVFTLTLSGSGSISGATVTATIEEEANPGVALSTALTGHTCAISDATNRIVTLTITSAEAAGFRTSDHAPYSETIRHIADVKMVLSGATSHYGPFIFKVRKAIT